MWSSTGTRAVSSRAFFIFFNPFHNLERGPRTSKIFCWSFFFVASWFKTCALYPIIDFTKLSNFLPLPDMSGTFSFLPDILILILFWNKIFKLVIDIICHFTRKLPFVTLSFQYNLKSVAFSRITFLDWFFWRGRIPWIRWRSFWWWFPRLFIFSLFAFANFLCCSSEQGVIIIILAATSILAVITDVGSILNICNWLSMFPSITMRRDGGKFVEQFSRIKKSLGAVSRTSA